MASPQDLHITPGEQDHFDLLESGEQYFPAVLKSIAEARTEVLIETFILLDDKVGRALQRALLMASKRSVEVHLTVDGYGSSDLPNAFIHKLIDNGVHIHIYDPRPRFLGLRTNVFRRLHRKLIVIDGMVAYVGGINYAADQLPTSHPAGKLDFAAHATGPIVRSIHHFMRQQIDALHQPNTTSWPILAANITNNSSETSELAVRDNDVHRDDIERHYRVAIHSAKRHIILCNAYFFPGYRLLAALRRAVRRGVKVTLILQGEPDQPTIKSWEKLLYGTLIQSGVHVVEYLPHPLHAKVAVIDQQWATVGSSNLDPLSLALNLEANLIIRNRRFCRMLHARLDEIIHQHCKPVAVKRQPWHRSMRIVTQTVAYHLTRHFPTWTGWLPAHTPRVHSLHTNNASDTGRSLLKG